MIKAFWRELFTPSGIEGPASDAYRRGAEAVFHAVLGAAVVSLLALIGIDVGLMECIALTGVYSIKEVQDRRNGGSAMDSLEDTFSVFLGGSLFGAAVMPIVILALGVVVMLIHIGDAE